MKVRPKILTIAGFDPTGGAGVLADIKTFEQHKCYGFAVQTANTIQNEDEFLKTNWIDHSEIFDQINVLCSKHRFEFVKIGLIQNLNFLSQILALKTLSNVKFVWDPILKTSSGFDLKHDVSDIDKILKRIYMITPNWDEMTFFGTGEDPKEVAKELGRTTKVYLKGGHNSKDVGRDYLFYNDKELSFKPKRGNYSEKHGSGCVFSSSITANLSKGLPLIKSALKSKRYIEKVLQSTPNKLGLHS